MYTIFTIFTIFTTYTIFTLFTFDTSGFTRLVRSVVRRMLAQRSQRGAVFKATEQRFCLPKKPAFRRLFVHPFFGPMYLADLASSSDRACTNRLACASAIVAYAEHVKVHLGTISCISAGSGWFWCTCAVPTT